jgi:mannose-6-phosphate isomerase-like protein (cupin superfamily)
MALFNMVSEKFSVGDGGAQLLWGTTYEGHQSADGSLTEVTPYHYHTKREYLIVGIAGEYRMIVGTTLHSVKPQDILVIGTHARHMEVDVGSRDFKVLMVGYDPPGEDKVLVPYREIPPELLPIIERQPLRYAIPGACSGPTDCEMA